MTDRPADLGQQSERRYCLQDQCVCVRMTALLDFGVRMFACLSGWEKSLLLRFAVAAEGGGVA